MTEEFKVILGRYIKECVNNPESCAASETDSNGMQTGKQHDIIRSFHPPDYGQGTDFTSWCILCNN